MNTREKILLFSEQIMCGADIYTWYYDTDLNLLHSNCPREEALDETLNAFGGKDELRSCIAQEETSRPFVLSVPIGLVWCAVWDRQAAEKRNVYVIGPVWSTDANLSGQFLSMESISKDRGVSLDWLREMDAALRTLPVVMPRLMYQYALMLCCTVTGERLNLSDIIYRETHGITKPEAPLVRDRYRTWHLEQTMLDMVRNGDMGYQKAFNQISNVSSGVPLKNSAHLRQAKTSVIVFTSLCTRAAIEGGMTPEQAYTLGDSYIQSVENCGTITEVASYSYAMYADFVKRVHSIRLGQTISSHIRAVCDYIELHADEPFTNADLANRAGYSEQYLRRKFASETGMALPEYIRNVRIQRAKALLTGGELSIQEIADRLQFCSRAHFSDVFCKVVGLTPAKFREKAIRV